MTSAEPAAGERDDDGDDRDVAAGRRDAAGDLRDRAGSARDLRGDERDRSAESRDRAAAVAERRPGSDISGAEHLRSAKARDEAAADRSRSFQDRQAGADERARAVSDRLTASVDRLIALSDRSASAADREIASMDELTGAHLRGAGLFELQREIDRARRNGQPLGLAFVDVDHLKHVNDSLGHAAGDQVLVDVVVAMRARLRSYDLVVRAGGDEFLCVLSGLDLVATAGRLTEVNASLAARAAPVSVTIGVAEMLPDGDTPAELIVRADADLYRNRAAASHGPPEA